MNVKPTLFNRINQSSNGVTLISAMILLVTLIALSVTYFRITNYHVDIAKSSKKTSFGYYSAEAGLNLRIQDLRSTFTSFALPVGTSPTTTNPCTGSNLGSGEFACETTTIGDHTVVTYVQDLTLGNPVINIIPAGDDFASMQALEYQYILHSKAVNPTNGKTEAILGMRITSRVIPMLQFAAFYDQDLEILSHPTPLQILGPVHSNNNIYFYGDSIKVSGPVTTAGNIIKGWKGTNNTTLNLQFDEQGGTDDTYNWRSVSFDSPTIGGYQTISNKSSFTNTVKTGVDPAESSEYADIARNSNSDYWSRADLRIVLNLNTAGTAVDESCMTGNEGFEVQNVDGSCNTTLTQKLITNCSILTTSTPGLDAKLDFTQFAVNGTSYSPTGYSASSTKTVITPTAYSNQTFASDLTQNHGYGRCLKVIDVNLSKVMQCIQSQTLVTGGISKTAGGGLTLFFSVEGPESADNPSVAPRFNSESPGSDYLSKYAVRFTNGSNLKNPYSGAPNVRGLALASDIPVYIKGNFNIGTGKTFSQLKADPYTTIDKIPVILVGDRLYVQSSSWSDTLDTSCSSFAGSTTLENVDNRNASDTAIFAGFYFKLPISCGSSTGYSCGLGGSNYGYANYAQLQEDWSAANFLVHGAFINLNRSIHATATSDANYTYISSSRRVNDYEPPLTRNYSFDTDFMDLDSLPPASPNFVKIKQEFFVQYFTESEF